MDNNYYFKIISSLYDEYGINYTETFNKSNIFINSEQVSSSKLINKESLFFSILCTGSQLVFCCDEKILNLMKEKFRDYPSSWIFNFQTLNEINEILKKFNYQISPFSHHYYIPYNLNKIDFELKTDFLPNMHELSPKEIIAQNIPQTFKNIQFSLNKNCFYCLAYEINSEIIGICTSKKKNSLFWEIAIEIKQEYRQKSLAKQLLEGVKIHLIQHGYIPYYGTSESNIASQRTAISCGFKPFWAQVLSEKIK